MSFTELMTMTASTNKRKKKKRKRKKEIWVFTVVLLAVLTLGGAGLALMAAGRGEEEKPEPEAVKNPEIEATLLSGVQLEAMEQREKDNEIKTEEPPTSRYGALLQDEAAMKENNIYAKEAASSEEIVFAFAGDILFDPQYAVMANLIQRGGGIEDAFSPQLLAVMRSADVFVVNNEFPYSNRGTPLPEKQFTFRAEPERAEYLKTMGVDAVSLANNHAYDFGEISLLDTLDTLDEMEIPYTGAGRDLEEASRPVSFIINDKRIAVLAATQIERNDNPDTRGATENSAGTFRCWNVENLLKAVAKAKAENDYVIVYIHWGTENQAETDWAQIDQAGKIAEAGADAIIGAHSHCLQPVGFVKGIPVVYSLGNFWFNSKTLDTALAKVIIPAQGKLRVQILPAKQSDCRTQLLEGEQRSRVLEYINSISAEGRLDEEGYLCP